MKDRIRYLDGLKAIMAIVIVATHYMLALWPKGYIGYGSNVGDNALEWAKEGMPWSFFSNTSISLYLLFGLISFFIVLSFRNHGNDVKVLQRQASTRYFQFVIPVFVASVAAFVLYQTGVLQYDKVAQMTGSSWNIAVIPNTESVKELLFCSVIGTYFSNSIESLTVLWCMNIIFLGSFLTYGLFALFGTNKKRYIVYIAYAVVSFMYPKFVVFLAGALNAEIYYCWKSEKKFNSKWTMVGVPCILAGIVIGLIPAPMLPTGITLGLSYAVSSFLILFGLMCCPHLQKILECKGIRTLGKYLFSIILVHIFVLYTFSAWLYEKLGLVLTGACERFLITTLLSLPVIIAVSIVFYKLFEEPSRKLAHYVGEKIEVKF